MIFSKTLIHWYLQNKRDLPWRNSTNPYHIWLSEIILQQTRVAQGTPYFAAFIENFPTIHHLAQASEQQVLKLWQGLGYYSRARNLHKTAQIISFEMNGVFPKNYLELLKLKGVGEYTAAAIASFAYNERVAVVDGNVFRVLSRYIGIENDIADAKSKNVFKETAQLLMEHAEPNVFNQAIMEFGALQCVPKNPNCTQCVFNQSCFALQQKKVLDLPVKTKKAKSKNRFFNYLIFIDSTQKTIVQERRKKGIWQNLYEFPLLETDNTVNEAVILDEILQKKHLKSINFEVTKVNDEVLIHKLTHQNLHITFWKIEVHDEIEGAQSFEEIKKLPFPIVIYNFLEKIY
jgi:A/G-specific adenine glycosylase